MGIPTAPDRIVQASLKLVLEPIFEADFHPCSYGFRPRRRAQDAIAEIHYLTTRSYEWVFEGDIKACFDEIDHNALMGRIRDRIKDKRAYFQHGVSHRTFSYLEHFTFWRVFGWLRKRHLGLNKHTLVRRHLPGWEVRDAGIEMMRPKRVSITRYRYRGAKIPNPWSSSTTGTTKPAA